MPAVDVEGVVGWLFEDAALILLIVQQVFDYFPLEPLLLRGCVALKRIMTTVSLYSSNLKSVAVCVHLRCRCVMTPSLLDRQQKRGNHLIFLNTWQ